MILNVLVVVRGIQHMILLELIFFIYLIYTLYLLVIYINIYMYLNAVKFVYLEVLL